MALWCEGETQTCARDFTLERRFCAVLCVGFCYGCGMDMPLTLYYAPDNASLCVRLALLELRQPYQTVLVDRAKMGQMDAGYLALNPNGLIPTLMTPEGPIYETGAILLWLDGQVAGGFMPPDMPRGESLTWLMWLSNTLHPCLRMWFYPSKYIGEAGVPALLDVTRVRLLDLFAHLEAHAGWFDRAAPSALGCYIAPMVRWAALYGPEQAWFDLSKYPKLKSYVTCLEQRASAHEASVAEGLGETIFSDPANPNPPEGSAV